MQVNTFAYLLQQLVSSPRLTWLASLALTSQLGSREKKILTGANLHVHTSSSMVAASVSGSWLPVKRSLAHPCRPKRSNWQTFCPSQKVTHAFTPAIPPQSSSKGSVAYCTHKFATAFQVEAIHLLLRHVAFFACYHLHHLFRSPALQLTNVTCRNCCCQPSTCQQAPTDCRYSTVGSSH